MLHCFCVICRYTGLIQYLSKKRPGVPLEDFILYNTSLHTVGATALELAILGFGSVSHPPYSPDLAPFVFAMFKVSDSLPYRSYGPRPSVLHNSTTVNGTETFTDSGFIAITAVLNMVASTSKSSSVIRTRDKTQRY